MPSISAWIIYAAISEGTLIASCRPQKADAVVKALAKKGIKSSIVGELIAPKKGMILVEDGKEKELKHPSSTPSGELSTTRWRKQRDVFDYTLPFEKWRQDTLSNICLQRDFRIWIPTFVGMDVEVLLFTRNQYSSLRMKCGNPKVVRVIALH